MACRTLAAHIQQPRCPLNVCPQNLVFPPPGKPPKMRKNCAKSEEILKIDTLGGGGRHPILWTNNYVNIWAFLTYLCLSLWANVSRISSHQLLIISCVLDFGEGVCRKYLDWESISVRSFLWFAGTTTTEQDSRTIN